MLQASWIRNLGLQIQPFEELRGNCHASCCIRLDLTKDILGRICAAILILGIDGLSGRMVVHGRSRVEVFANVLVRVHIVLFLFVRVVDQRKVAEQGEAGWHWQCAAQLFFMLSVPLRPSFVLYLP